MKKFFYSLVFAGIALGANAQARTYLCELEDRYANGWMPKFVVIGYEDKSKPVKVWGFGREHGEYAQAIAARPEKFDEHLSGKVVQISAKRDKFSAVDHNVEAVNNSGLTVRYSMTVTKPAMDARVSIAVGNHGQTEFGRGTCEAVS